MSFLSQEEIDALRIERFIFHVVHHGQEEATLLEETPLGDFESFFLGRVMDTLEGNRFQFVTGSPTCDLLRECMLDGGKFVENSKKLAIDFHGRHDKRIKPGVLIVMLLSAGDNRLFSLIKYDHEQVLTYDIEGGARAVLREIANSLTKSKKALHKSALIRLKDDGGDIIVVDYTVRHEITDFFRGFLNSKRKYTSKEMTQTIHKCTLNTMKVHQSSLPEDVTRNISKRVFEAIQETDIFEEDSFVDKVFGPYASERIRKTFKTNLEKNDLAGESFTLDKRVVKRPRAFKWRTQEGVEIKYGQDAEDTVKIEPGAGSEKTVIKITTTKLSER